MKPFVLALRAVGTEFVMRIYLTVVISVAVLFVVLGVVTVWLTTFSVWWWLLFIPIVIFFSVFVAVAFVIFSLVRFVRPIQTKAQKQAVKQFTDRIQNVTDIVGTPKIIILFRVVRSISAPSKDTYLTDLVNNKDLAREFLDLQRSFNT